MFCPKSGVAALVAGMVFMNSVAFAGGTGALQSEVRSLRAKIDQGSVDPRDAIDAFAKSIADKNITVAEVDAYVKSRLSAREYRAFRWQIDGSLAGIDPERVSAHELGQVVGQALQQIGSQGLSWSACASTWTGVGIAVAAVIAGIFALVKNKSDSKIKQEYEGTRSSFRLRAERDVHRSRYWQTAIPGEIDDAQAALARASAEADVYDSLYQQELRTGDMSSESITRRTEYANRRDSANSSTITYASRIRELRELFDRYTANPDLALQDIVRFESQLVVDLDRITGEEAVALSRAPADRQLAGRLGIGAGIGAAAGTFLIVRGTLDGCGE